MIAAGLAVIMRSEIWHGPEFATASGIAALVQSALVRTGIAASTYVEIRTTTDYLKYMATEIGFWSHIDKAVSF
jgi:hypothetical protein